MTTDFHVELLVETDSTSTHAARLLKAGRKPPFAVIARKQTEGRGRRGATWESPAGNLYMTVALPAEAAASSSLPLKAATLVARFLADEFHLRVTLKWPNDVLFSGQKLAGLLLEGSAMGERTGDVLVGIGINLAVAPKLTGASYDAISLQEITGKTVDPEIAGANLARYLVDHWHDIAPDGLPEAFEQYALGVGQLWRERATGELRRGGQPRLDGSLPLVAIGGESPGSAITLASADHGYGWIYQGESVRHEPLAVADVGNTQVKLAFFTRATDPEPAMVEPLPLAALTASLPDAMIELRRRLPADGWPVHIASVNPEASAKVTEAALAVGLAPQVVPKRPVLRHGLGYALKDLGIDRLAALEGYLAALSPAQRANPHLLGVVVACGTATTIDVIRANGEHLGGLILPGLDTSLTALHEAAALLPRLAIDRSAPPPATLGRDTPQAMLHGAVILTVGAIERVVRQAASADPNARFDIALTGGFAPAIAPEIQGRVLASLIPQGIRAMVLGGLH